MAEIRQLDCMDRSALSIAIDDVFDRLDTMSEAIESLKDDIDFLICKDDINSIRGRDLSNKNKKKLLMIHGAEAFKMFDSADEDVTLFSLRVFPKLIIGMNNPTEEMYKISLRYLPSIYKMINKPSKELTKWFVDHDPKNIYWVENPDEDIWKSAILEDYTVISKIQCKITSEMRLFAYGVDPDAVAYIQYFNKAEWGTILERTPKSIFDMNDPTDEMIKYAIFQDPNIVTIRPFFFGDTYLTFAIIYSPKVYLKLRKLKVTNFGMLWTYIKAQYENRKSL